MKKQFENKLIRTLKGRINRDIGEINELKEDTAVTGIKAKTDRDIRKIKTKINGDIESKKDYYKPVRVRNFRNNNYIQYESNGDRNKNLPKN